MTADPDTDAAAIEQEVRRTQDEIGDTVGKLGEQLNSHGLLGSFMSGDSAANRREAWGIARENPAPVALVAVGAAWLLLTSETPSLRDLRERLIGRVKVAVGLDPPEIQRTPPGGPPAETGGNFDRRQRQAARS